MPADALRGICLRLPPVLENTMNRLCPTIALAIALVISWPTLSVASQSVQVVQVEPAPLLMERRLPGRIEAVHAVALRSRIEGIITQVHFSDGQQVKAGDLLYELDDAEQRAALSLAQAELRSSEASLRQAQQQFDRFQRLKPAQAISNHDVDGARMQRDIARAAVDQAKSRLKTREITLGYTRIASPVSGRVGHSQFHRGSLVNPASGMLVEIVQLDPIRIAFAIEEHAFFDKAGQHPDLKTLRQAWLPEIELAGKRQAGTLVSVDNRIDPRSGSVTLRAEFANPGERLLPGGSIDLFFRPKQSASALMIPAMAIQQDPQGFFCWLVNDENKTEKRRLTLGSQQGQQYQVLSGLQRGERVIVEGTQRLQAGSAVNAIAAGGNR
jgi:RND family efflux transporter MFP subunit